MDHDAVLFREFDRPVRSDDENGNVVATHWGTCPVSGDPILLHIEGEQS